MCYTRRESVKAALFFTAFGCIIAAIVLFIIGGLGLVNCNQQTSAFLLSVVNTGNNLCTITIIYEVDDKMVNNEISDISCSEVGNQPTQIPIAYNYRKVDTVCYLHDKKYFVSYDQAVEYVIIAFSLVLLGIVFVVALLSFNKCVSAAKQKQTMSIRSVSTNAVHSIV